MDKIADAFSLIRNGANIKQGLDDSGYPITRIETISNRTVDRDKMGYAGITDITKYSDYVLQDGDILMSHINSETHLGKVARYEKYEGETIIHGMNLLCLRPNKNLVDSRYAFYYLSSEAFLHQIPRITKKSVNQASFNVAALKELTFPISSMEVQQLVADILDKANELIALRKEQLAKLDELIKARFVEMFGDPELNPRLLPVLPWNAVFLTTTGKLDANAMVENGRYPFFTCAKESYKIDSYAFDCEALLLAGNNAAGIYDVKHYKGKFNAYQRTYVLRLMNEKWSYILFKRQLEDKLQYLQSQSKGTNTRYLTLGILNELHFVVPPVAEQEQFAAFVKQTDKSKVAVQKALDEAQLLFDSLMQKYFG
mgnify:FL=1